MPAMDAIRLLLIEDDADIRALTEEFLTREGYEILALETGRGLGQHMAAFQPQLVILDIMLPGDDGLTLCRRLRQESTVPIMMLTAKSADVDKIVGLELGADDYLTKPFNPRELLARIRALLRRAATAATPGATLSLSPRKGFAGLVIDIDGRQLETAGGTGVPLTTAEFDLLVCLVQHPRRVLSRDQLLDWTRGRRADPLDRTIDVTVSRLRSKLAALAPAAAQAITTVRNGGYLFSAPVEDR